MNILTIGAEIRLLLTTCFGTGIARPDEASEMDKRNYR